MYKIFLEGSVNQARVTQAETHADWPYNGAPMHAGTAATAALSYSSRAALGYLFPVSTSAEYGTRLCTRDGNHTKSSTMHAIPGASLHRLFIPSYEYYVSTQSVSRGVHESVQTV